MMMAKPLTITRRPVLAATLNNLGYGDFFTVEASQEIPCGSGNPYLKFSQGDLCYVARDVSKGEKKVVNLVTGECTHAFPPNAPVCPVNVEATIQNRTQQ